MGNRKQIEPGYNKELLLTYITLKFNIPEKGTTVIDVHDPVM